MRIKYKFEFLLKQVIFFSAALLSAANAYAQPKWFYTGNSDTCRTEVGIPEHNAGLSILRMSLRGQEVFGVGLYFRGFNSSVPPLAMPISSVVRIDGEDRGSLVFNEATVSESKTLTYMSFIRPTDEFIQQMKDGSTLSVLLDPTKGFIDISLKGSRSALDGWLECVEEARSAVGAGRGLAVHEQRKFAEKGDWFAQKGQGSLGRTCGLVTTFLSDDEVNIFVFSAEVKSRSITRVRFSVVRLNASLVAEAPENLEFASTIDGAPLFQANLTKVADINGPAYIAAMSSDVFYGVAQEIADGSDLTISSVRYFNAKLSLNGFGKSLKDFELCVASIN